MPRIHLNNPKPQKRHRTPNEIRKPQIIVQKKPYHKKGNYYLLETIGEGAFAKVKLGLHIPTGEKVAIKILNKERLFEDIEEICDIKKIKKEINILKRIRHKNVIQLYEIMESKSNLYIVMEYCENKELFDYIVSKKFLKEKEACRFFQQIIDGVEYLHLSNITHRDLKPENLLLDKNFRIKISDFGLSYIGKNIDSLLDTPCGTPSYAPPEMLRGEKYNGVYSDIWSCGIILYTMLVGNLPCAESKEELIYENIINHNYYYPDYISKEAVDLIENMLKINPRERYDFEQIKAHPWFNLIEPKLKPGIVYGIHKIPVDDNILKLLEKKYGCDKETCRESISNYIFDSNSSLYYLTLKQLIRDKKKSVSDLISDEYVKYLKNNKNWIKVDEISNPLFINYQAEMPFEIEQEKAKKYISDALMNYDIKNSNNFSIFEKHKEDKDKNKNIYINEIQNYKSKVQNSEIIIKNNEKDNSNKKTYLNMSLIVKNDRKNNKKVKKNISYGEINGYKLNSVKIKDFIKKRVINKKEQLKTNIRDKNLTQVINGDKYNIITKRTNKEHNFNKSDYKNKSILYTNRDNIIKSAQTRPKNILLKLENSNHKNIIPKKINKFNLKLNKIARAKNNNILNSAKIPKKNLSNKFINISEIENQAEQMHKLSNKDLVINSLDKTITSDSISFNSKIVLSPKAFSSFSNNSDINSNNINVNISKKDNNNYNIILNKLNEEEKANLKNKLENDEKKFNKDMNIINNITTDTTMNSSNNSNENIINNNNSNFIQIMAKKMIKNSIFGKYLLKNKKPKKSIKTDVEKKFYTLQKYKDIIGLIENIKNKIFKNKYVDFNYEEFDKYLNDEDDKIFSCLLLKNQEINNFITKAKSSLYRQEKQNTRSFSNISNLKKYKFKNKLYLDNNIYSTTKKFKNFEPKRNLGFYKKKKVIKLSYVTSEYSKNNIKIKKNRKINNSVTSYNESMMSSFSNYNINNTSNANINNINSNINKKLFPQEKEKDININKTLEYDSDISLYNSRNNIFNNKNIINTSMKDINEKEESFYSNKNINENSINSKELDEDNQKNGIYKKNINIITPQLGPKSNIFLQNSPNKYDSDEKNDKDIYLLNENMPLTLSICVDMNEKKNKMKDIEIKDNEQLKEDIRKLSENKLKIINGRNNNTINDLNKLDNNNFTNRTTVTFKEKNKNNIDIKIKKEYPLDLNCVIFLSFNEIKSKIKFFFKKLGFFYSEKNETIKINKGNSNIEFNIYKFDFKNSFYLNVKIKSKDIKKDKDNIRKLLNILNNNKMK